MKWSVSFPEESILLVRPCLIAICHDNRPAAKLLSVLLYRHSIRQEHQSDAESINEVRGDDSQDITFRIYRKQSKLVTDMCNEITEKTLHDVAVPVLQLLGYLDVDETPTIHCYDLHVDVVVKALEAYKQGPKQLQQTLQSNLQLEKFLINIQLEKVLINKKNFQLALEKVLIANRNTSNNKRGRKPKPDALREPQSEEPQINIEIDSKIGNREEGVGSGEPTAPANVYHLEEKRQKRETDPRMKAVKIGDTNATTDHSTHSSVLPGEHHSDTVSEDICKTRQDDGASSTGHAPEKAAGQSELNTHSSRSGTSAPARRSESLSPHAAVQGADKRKGKRKPGAVPDVQPVPKCDTREIQRRINEHRGYALEEDTEIIRERKAIKTWCNLHTLEEYSQVMQGLKKDKYWGKDENYYRIGGLILLKETPGILAKRNNYPLKAVANGDVAPQQEDDDYSGFDIYKGNGKEERAALRALGEQLEKEGKLVW